MTDPLRTALATPGLTDVCLTFGHPVYGIECTVCFGLDDATVVNQPDPATAIIAAVAAATQRRSARATPTP